MSGEYRKRRANRASSITTIKRELRKTGTYTSTDRSKEVVGSRQHMRAARQYSEQPGPDGTVVLSQNKSRRRRQLAELERSERKQDATGGVFGAVSLVMPGHATRFERRRGKRGYTETPDGKVERSFNDRAIKKMRRAANEEANRLIESEIQQRARVIYRDPSNTMTMRHCRNVARMDVLSERELTQKIRSEAYSRHGIEFTG